MSKHLIIGLGNPGAKYAQTRHNLGARVVQVWVDKVETEFLREHGVELLLPIDSMNNSGRVVAQHIKQTSAALESVLIVHDDMELPLGEVRMIPGGSAKGHNGVKSIQEALATKDIPRLRLGIGRPPEGVEPSEFVLERFLSEEEKLVLDKVIPQAVDLIQKWIEN